MKNPIMTVLVLACAGLATGCKPSTDADGPPAGGTNAPSAAQSLHLAGNYAASAATNALAATSEAWTGVKAALQPVIHDTYEHKDAFVAKASEGVKALDQQIKVLSDKAAQTGQSYKADVQTKLQQLRDQRAALDDKLTHVKNATAADWDTVKTNLQSTCDKVDNSFKDAWHALTGG
jgi:hypothetical protein